MWEGSWESKKTEAEIDPCFCWYTVEVFKGGKGWLSGGELWGEEYVPVAVAAV